MITFKERAKRAGNQFGMTEGDAAEALVVMHEILETLIDGRIPIRIKGVFRTKYRSTKFKDNIQIGENKRMVKKSLATGKTFYIAPVTKTLIENESDILPKNQSG